LCRETVEVSSGADKKKVEEVATSGKEEEVETEMEAESTELRLVLEETQVCKQGCGAGAGAAGAGLFWVIWSRSREFATAPAPDQA